MTDDERNAMEWLDARVAHEVCVEYTPATTIKSMLARPVLPEEPTPAMLDAMLTADGEFHPHGPTRRRAIYRAIYAHLTAPRTKEVEVWRVEWADRGEPKVKQFDSSHSAGSFSEELEANRDGSRERPKHACIRVTGPHKQQVPA